MREPKLEESRFWVLARRPQTARSLPFGWANVLSVAILLARVVHRCGLEAVRVVDRDAPPAFPSVLWRPDEGDGT